MTLRLPKNQDTSLGLTVSNDPNRKYRATLFVNGWQVGNYVNYLGPQHSFPVPNGILNPDGRNSIALAVWNLDGSTGGLGKVSLTDYGSYTSSLRVAQNHSPGYKRATYAMAARPGTSVSLKVADAVRAGTAFTARATVRVPAGGGKATDLTAALALPSGWTAGTPSPTSLPILRPGQAANVTWQVRPPSGALAQASALAATVRYTQRRQRVSNTDERIERAVPAPPPAGTDAVSDLSFLASSNGWGPVERDLSNGDSGAGDGRPLSVAGVTYPKGLGTNSPSDVELYLGGSCSRFTASVGVDDETNGAGTVTFSVIGDGQTLVTTPTIKGNAPALAIDVPVTGAQVLELVVGEAG